MARTTMCQAQHFLRSFPGAAAVKAKLTEFQPNWRPAPIVKLVLGQLTYRLDQAGLPKVLGMQIVAWVLLSIWALGTVVVLALDASQFRMLGIF